MSALPTLVHQEIVWIDAIKRTSTRYGILQHPSRTLDSLPLETLRDLALQPHRLDAPLRTSKKTDPKDEFGKVLCPHSAARFKDQESGAGEFRERMDHRAIPPNRYIVNRCQLDLHKLESGVPLAASLVER